MTGDAQRAAWETIATLYAISVAINYPWELAQGVLFTPESHVGYLLLHCFVASLGDGLLVLLLLALDWITLGRLDWFVRSGIRGYATLLASGAALAIAVKWFAVHVLRRWAYTDAMPRVPGLDIGLVPVLQMMLLPPLIFYMTAALIRRAAKSARRHG